MGNVINTILSSPLPTIIAVVVALLLAAGYWFFVLPGMEELKNLRTRNMELESEVLNRLNLDTIDNIKAQLDAIKATVERPTGLDSLKESLTAIKDGIRELKESLNTSGNSSVLLQLNTIERNTERLLRNVADLSDKQSQATGVLLGLSMTSRNAPPRGP